MANPSKEETTILRFDPPHPVFRVAVIDGLETVVTESLKKEELISRMRIAIPNPWAEEKRYLPGVVYGDDVQFLMDVGQSFGSLEFREELGWVCRALVPKTDIMSGVIQTLREKAKGSFTQRLIKRATPKKKK